MGWNILRIILIGIVKLFELAIKIFALLIDGIELLINVFQDKC